MIIIHLDQVPETMTGVGLINIFQELLDSPFHIGGQLQDPQEQDKESK